MEAYKPKFRRKLSEALGGTQGPTPSDTFRSTSGPASPSTIRAASEELNRLAGTDAGVEIDPELLAQIQTKRDQAESAYKSEKSTNEWGELAQLVGRAFAQLGGARAGMKSGNDMSNLNFGPGIDYGARTERAARDRDSKLGELRNESRDLESERRHIEARDSQTLSNRLKGAGEKLDAEKFMFGEQNQAARAGRGERNQLAMLINQQIDESRAEAAPLEKQAQAYDDLINSLNNFDKLDSKNKKKFKGELPTLAAKAGIPVEDLEKALAEAKADDGWFDGKSVEQHIAEKLKGNPKIEEARNRINSYRKQREDLMKQRDGLMGIKPAPKMVKMKGPDGSVAEVPEDQVEKYKKQGAIVVN